MKVTTTPAGLAQKEEKLYQILIVDDDKDDHLFLRLALREVMPRASIESLFDGKEAIEYLSSCDTLPHLIFLDLNMAKISGKTATRLIRRNKRLDNVPVIILTTSQGDEEKKELIGLGATDFYTKPYSINDFVGIIKNVKNNWLNQIN